MAAVDQNDGRLKDEQAKILRGAAILLGITFLAYLPALRGGFIWDDDDYVTNNANLRSLPGLVDTWVHPTASPQYYPMVFTTFWFEHQLWGNAPPGYHFDNVLLHALAVFLLWRVLSRLGIPVALAAACLFAVHPINVESVAWITERKNVLSAVFYFASALLFLRGSNVLVVVVFALALLSKSVTCSLPAALLLVLWWKRRTPTRWEWIALAVMFALGLTMAATTAWLERLHVQAVGREWNLSALDRVLIAGRAIWFYATKIVLPLGLSFVYPKWPIDPREVWQWAFPVGVIVAIAVLWQMRDRWGRGPLVGALIFAGTLVPALGFFNIYPMRYTFAADHYAYHATAAAAVLIAIGLSRVLGPRGVYFLVPPLLFLTLVRCTVYADPETLWRDTLRKNPDSWMVNLNLAQVLVKRGNEAEAQQHFERQVALAPELAETHWKMGVNFARRNMPDDAIAEYDRAIERDPRFPQAYFGRGDAFVAKGDLVQAQRDYERAIELKPDYAEAHHEMAQVLVRTRHFQAALAHYMRAIEIDPNLAKAHLNLAALLRALGRQDEARQQFDEAVRLDPHLAEFADQVLGPRVNAP